LSSDPKVNTLIEEESVIYGDILQGDFIESYNNLTFKALMSWQWMIRRCDLSNTTGIQTIMKVDDDVVINSAQLIGNMSKIESNQFACRVLKDSPIIRNKTSEDYLSFTEYPWPRKNFQTYCAGGWYLFNSDLLEPLYKLAEINYGFLHDDVYIGMLATCLPSLSFGVDHRSWQYEWFAGDDLDLRQYLAVMYVDKQELFLKAWDAISYRP
jgi:beta-1,3-galactosyltransferase 1